MEDIKIDTALLGEVLEIVIIEAKLSDTHLLYTSYIKPRLQDWKSLNLDTLTRLMKEWCLEQGYMLMSSPNYIGTITIQVSMKGLDLLCNSDFKTEVEAVYKATEYVYKQVKGK